MTRRLVLTTSLAALLAIAFTANEAQAQGAVAVVNAASFKASFPLSPGCWASAFGNFASAGVSTTIADAVPFPLTLGGVQVFVNDAASPISFVSATQINFIVPRETPEGPASIRVTVSGMTAFEGSFNVWPISPALISVNPADPTKPGAVLNQDLTVNGPQNPARRGEVVVLFGFGADFTELPANGSPAPSDRLIRTATDPKVYISVIEAAVQFSGLAPSLVNAWQLNVIVPDNAAIVSGQVPVSAEVLGLASNPVSIWVSQ
jgi:uncharacterized protein (TIGR03437 family)